MINNTFQNFSDIRHNLEYGSNQSNCDNSVSFICENEEYGKERNMSFAGIVFAKNGMDILGFADSKPSLQNGRRILPDYNRDTVQKIFSTDNFVITLTGGNSIRIMQNGCPHLFYLQDWINEHLNEFATPKELCLNLFFFINQNSASSFPEIQILAGYFSGVHSIKVSCKISQDTYSLKEEEAGNSFQFFSGNSAFVGYCENNRNILDVENEEELRTNLHKLYAILDFGDNYNPVGEPWDIRKISFIKEL